jgi:hypothetical protein
MVKILKSYRIKKRWILKPGYYDKIKYYLCNKPPTIEKEVIISGTLRGIFNKIRYHKSEDKQTKPPSLLR